MENIELCNEKGNRLFCVGDDCELRQQLAAKDRQLEAAAKEAADREVTIQPRDLAYISSKPFDEMMRDCCRQVWDMKKKAAEAARKRWKETADWKEASEKQ